MSESGFVRDHRMDIETVLAAAYIYGVSTGPPYWRGQGSISAPFQPIFTRLGLS